MNILKQNKKRKMVSEYGPYLNQRIAVYDNTGTMGIWFSDKRKAEEWWKENKDRETYSEQRKRERQERLALIGALPDIDEYDEELPFM